MESTAADQVWLNGIIYPMDDDFSTFSALAWKNGRIIYAGNDEGAKVFIGPETITEDLTGKTVLPGLIDSHLHLQLYGEGLVKLQIRDSSKDEILKKVHEAAGKAKKGEWILGAMGWNNELWQDTAYPGLPELDEVSPDNPVYLPRMDGHIAWVNSRAFREAGIVDSTPSPQGGEFIHTPEGHLQGCATDSAARMIQAKIPKPDKVFRQQALLAAQKKLFQNGITCIQDAGTFISLVKDLKELYGSEKYKIRFYGALNNVFLPEADAELKSYLEQCPEIALFDGRYTVRTVKFFADGSLGGRSAALFEDYNDRKGWRGILMYGDEEFYNMAKDAAMRGLRVMTHAIGDAAIDQTLSVYEKVLAEVPTKDHRFRIEHFPFITGNNLERTKALGVLVTMQATHGPNGGDMSIRRLGYDRASRGSALGPVQKALGMIAGGSDAPVDEPDPIDGIYASVTRRNRHGLPRGGLFPENSMTREAALRSYTIWAAKALFAEQECGSIEIGKRADFTILDGDIMKVPAEDILKIKVLRTVVNGETVFSRSV
jgi:predicted amidohydrolase YtcJ